MNQTVKHKIDVEDWTPEVKGRVSVRTSGSLSEASEGEENKVAQRQTRIEETQHPCGECRFCDRSTEREFRREGIRQGLVETRAICRAPKERTKASLHIVKKESNRPCFEAGVYVVPVKEKKTKEQPAETQTQPSVKTSKKHNGTELAVATNHPVSSGDTKVLEKTNGKSKRVIVKNVGEE